ncbi:hypothetical protein CRG98_047229, partial [Punica granatum]
AQFLGLQRGQEELYARLDVVIQALDRMAVAPTPPQRAHRVPRRNVRVEDEADLEDELLEEEEQPVPRRQQRGVSNNLKLKIPQFKGTSSPEEYIEWVLRVDKVFECYECSEAQKCQLAALEFTDYANLWWENLKAQRRRDREDGIRSWREMKRIMHRRFVPEYYKQDLFLKLQSIRQGGMSVEHYVMEFEMLSMRCEPSEPREQTIARFIGGLNKEIADVVGLQPYVFLEDLITLASKVEKQRKRSKLNASRVHYPKPMAASSGSSSKWNAQQK